MSSALQTELTGFRFVELLYADTLQTLAARELGDAAAWPTIAAINDLVAPYVVQDPALAGPGLALVGSLIRVPAPTATVTAATAPDQVFGRDVLLRQGQIAIEDGDFAVAAGLVNLGQALVHRIGTDRGDLIFHPEYGSLVRRLIGAVTGPTAMLLVAQYARAVVEADPRIASVSRAQAVAIGDSLQVRVEALPIVGRSIQVSTSF